MKWVEYNCNIIIVILLLRPSLEYCPITACVVLVPCYYGPTSCWWRLTAASAILDQNFNLLIYPIKIGSLVPRRVYGELVCVAL